MATRYRALHKRTVAFDLDVMTGIKVKAAFGGAGKSMSEALIAAVESAVASVKTTKAMLAEAETLIRANAEERIKRHEEFKKRSSYSKQHVRTVGIDEASLPKYAIKIVNKLRDEGMAI